MDNKLLKEYALLEFELRAIESKKEALREQILAKMKAAKIDREPTEFGTFSLVPKINWTYTEMVERLKEKWELAKLREQKRGVALKKIDHYLKFSPAK